MCTEKDILRGLDERRKNLGLSMPNLARRAGLGPATVQRALRSDSGVTLSTVVAIARALSVDIRSIPLASRQAVRAQQAGRKAKAMLSLAKANAALEGDFSHVTEGDLRRIERREKEALLAGSDLDLWS